jgi:hypothetical protein
MTIILFYYPAFYLICDTIWLAVLYFLIILRCMQHVACRCNWHHLIQIGLWRVGKYNKNARSTRNLFDTDT